MKASGNISVKTTYIGGEVTVRMVDHADFEDREDAHGRLETLALEILEREPDAFNVRASTDAYGGVTLEAYDPERMTLAMVLASRRGVGFGAQGKTADEGRRE